MILNTHSSYLGAPAHIRSLEKSSSQLQLPGLVRLASTLEFCQLGVDQISVPVAVMNGIGAMRALRPEPASRLDTRQPGIGLQIDVLYAVDPAARGYDRGAEQLFETK